MWRRSAFACLATGLVTALAACGGGSDATGDASTDKLAQILERGTLVGFFEPDYAPQSLANEGAEPPADTKCSSSQLTGPEVTGYDIAVTKLLAEQLGVEPCFVSPPWTEVTSGNWADRWDIAFGSGAITADRMTRLYMTQPYYAAPTRYFVRADSAYREPSDLDGKRIGVCVSCAQETYLKGELEIPGSDVALDVERPEIVVFEVEGPGLDALADGRIDAFLTGDAVGRAAIDDGAALRPLETVSFTEYLTGFVDRSSGLSSAEFVARVDEIVQGLHEDGTLRELSLEWFETDYTEPAADFDVEALGQDVQ
jgi:polar amino acid transport system substrate-binding protein